MPDPDFIQVRRPAGEPFRVLAEDLVSAEPTGYDLGLVRSLTQEGLNTPLGVKPLPGGRFRVVDGLKRLAAIRQLIRTNKPVYDTLRCIARPAGRVFALVRCRIQKGSGQADPEEGPRPGRRAIRAGDRPEDPPRA